MTRSPCLRLKEFLLSRLMTAIVVPVTVLVIGLFFARLFMWRLWEEVAQGAMRRGFHYKKLFLQKHEEGL